jgi:hypothetical protein
MKTKTTVTAAGKVAKKAAEALESERIGREAVIASQKLRARFDAERTALLRRYGVARDLD